MARYYQGLFKPSNPQKYKGDPSNIVYRSSLEFKFMREMDNNPSVLEWSSEEIIVPYRSPIDNKVHRYFPDFYVKKRNFSSGIIECLLVEIKPKSQTKPPKVQAKPNKKYLTEVATWGKNKAKWDAADKYCKSRGWNFVVITEEHLN